VTLRINITSPYCLTRLYIVSGVVNYRRTASDLGTCLILAVKFVYILNKLAVKKVERNVLWANTGTLSAVGAATNNVESSDNVEKLFLKTVLSSLVLQAGIWVIKYAVFAGASRANITAGVAADTS
jgi:hypothetical protein